MTFWSPTQAPPARNYQELSLIHYLNLTSSAQPLSNRAGKVQRHAQHEHCLHLLARYVQSQSSYWPVLPYSASTHRPGRGRRRRDATRGSKLEPPRPRSRRIAPLGRRQDCNLQSARLLGPKLLPTSTHCFLHPGNTTSHIRTFTDLYLFSTHTYHYQYHYHRQTPHSIASSTCKIPVNMADGAPDISTVLTNSLSPGE